MSATHPAIARPLSRALLFSAVLYGVLLGQTHADVGLTPMHADVVAAPGGGVAHAELTVMNTSDQQRTVRLSVEDFTVGEHGNLRFRPELDAPSPLLDMLERHAGARYVSLDEDQLTLAPYEERSVTCSVTLPANARGQYYAMVRADAGTVFPQARRGAAHNVRYRLQVGSALFITAGWESDSSRGDGEPPRVRRATPARYDVEVDDVRFVFPAAGDDRQTLRVVADVTNRSTVHYVGDVTAVVVNVEDRRIVERINFSQGVRLVLPNSKRVYVGEVRSRLDAGTYRIRFAVDGDTPRLRASYTTNVELMEAVAGLANAVGSMGVLDVTPTDTVTIGSRSEEERLRVYNNTDDALRVAARVTESADGPPRLRVSPRRFAIPAGGVRSVRLSARGRGGVAATAELALVPSTGDGATFPDRETRRLQVRVDAGGQDRRVRRPERARQDETGAEAP